MSGPQRSRLPSVPAHDRPATRPVDRGWQEGRPVLPRELLSLPNFLIIGAMKAGTTSLHMMLDQHPDIGMSAVKEVDFFVDSRFSRGASWYATHFDPSFPLRGESSTSYTRYPRQRDVPERIAGLIPDARLIYLVRDPIDRTVSHYLHAVHRRRESRTLAAALAELDGNHYVDPSRYAMQLRQYLRWFPRDQILVVSAESLRGRPRSTLETICDFLGVRSHSFDMREANASARRGIAHPLVGMIESYPAKRLGRRLPRSWVRAAKAVNERLSRRAERPRLDAETRARLVEYLADDVDALRRLTGRSFGDWSL